MKMQFGYSSCIHSIGCCWIPSLFLILLLSSNSANAEVMKLELLPRVIVKSEKICLSDVVKSNPMTPKNINRLLNMQIGTLSSSGPAIILSRKKLEFWVRMHGGAVGRNVILDGADSIEISVAVQKIDGTKVASFATAALTQWLKERADFVKLDVIGDVASVSVPVGGYDLQLSRISTPQILRKKMMLMVDILVNARVSKSIPVRFNVVATRKVWAAKKTLPKGIAISEDDVEPKELDLLTRSNNMIESLDFFKRSVRTKAKIPKGGIVEVSNTEIVPDVLKGDIATLVLRDGLVNLESKVEVMQDGFIGQTIKVKPINVKDILQVRVLSGNKVELR